MGKVEKYADVDLIEWIGDELAKELSDAIDAASNLADDLYDADIKVKDLQDKVKKAHEGLYAARLLRDTADPAVISLVSGWRRDA